MSRQPLLVYVCAGKDCSRAWERLCDASPRKWLKRHLEDAGLPGKVEVIRTECMDRCKEAANLCLVFADRACLETEVRRAADIERLRETARRLCEPSAIIADR